METNSSTFPGLVSSFVCISSVYRTAFVTSARRTGSFNVDNTINITTFCGVCVIVCILDCILDDSGWRIFPCHDDSLTSVLLLTPTVMPSCLLFTSVTSRIFFWSLNEWNCICQVKVLCWFKQTRIHPVSDCIHLIQWHGSSVALPVGCTHAVPDLPVCILTKIVECCWTRLHFSTLLCSRISTGAVTPSPSLLPFARPILATDWSSGHSALQTSNGVSQKRAKASEFWWILKRPSLEICLHFLPFLQDFIQFYLSLQRRAMLQQSSSQVGHHFFLLLFYIYIHTHIMDKIWICAKLLSVLASRKVWAHEEDRRLLCCCHRRHKCWAGSCHSYADYRAQIHPLLCKGKSTFQQAVHMATIIKSSLFPGGSKTIKKLFIDYIFVDY